MNLHVRPGTPLRGTTCVPGDKSLSHRAALFASLAEGTSTIGNFLVSGVTRAMLQSLSALRVEWRLEGTCLTVTGAGLRPWVTPLAPLQCGNSATTMRMLAGALAATGTPAVLDGSSGLRRRPMDRIVEPLTALGVRIAAGPHGGAPLLVEGRDPQQRLRGGTLALPVASAQVKSCLLLAGLAADAPLTVVEPGPSRDHTERLLRSMGVAIDTDGGRHAVTVQPPAAPLRPLCTNLPGDFSSAAFFIVAATITPGSDVRIENVGLNPTRTGLLDALTAMGADITIERRSESGGEPLGDIRVRAAPLRGLVVEGDLVVRMIDEFPAFAVAAAHADGRTTVRDAVELRHKESDRVSVLCTELTRVGIAIRESRDGFELEGGGVGGGVASACGDHRLAMSLALAGLASRAPVTVEGADILAESFPAFLCRLVTLGGRLLTHGPPGQARICR